MVLEQFHELIKPDSPAVPIESVKCTCSTEDLFNAHHPGYSGDYYGESHLIFTVFIHHSLSENDPNKAFLEGWKINVSLSFHSLPIK